VRGEVLLKVTIGRNQAFKNRVNLRYLFGLVMKSKGLREQGNGLLQKLVSKKGLATGRKPGKYSV
jgi:hypothetical protein